METQSRSYNNGTIIEYIFNVSNTKSNTSKSIFVNLETNTVITPNVSTLFLDKNSENKIMGVCCNAIEEKCTDGWITQLEQCWATVSGVAWGI